MKQCIQKNGHSLLGRKKIACMCTEYCLRQQNISLNKVFTRNIFLILIFI